MVKKFLITRLTHDIITSYLHDFSKEIVKTVKGLEDIHITNLESSKVTRANVEQYLKKENSKLVFLRDALLFILFYFTVENSSVKLSGILQRRQN